MGMELNAVKATMKKNRAHASHMLAKKTSAPYSQIEHDERAQLDTNGKLKQQTREATMAIQASLKEAKDDFAKRLTALHSTVVENDKKFEGKMDKLTGIVRANAVKSAEGRAQLKSIMDANKAELTAAVRDAVKKGEEQMAAAETHLVNLNAKTKAALNVKITSEISKLTKDANSQIEGLRLNSKEARDQMKKELLFAVRAMADEAKENLDAAVAMATEEFARVNKQEADAAAAAAEDRAAIAEQIAIEKQNVEDTLHSAVATMASSLLALKDTTRAAIAKTDTRVDAYAANMEKEFADISETMKTQMTTLTGKIEAQKESATADISAADAASAAGFASVMESVEAGLAAAAEDAAGKVKHAREDFATGLATVTAQIKAMDSKMTMN